VEVESETAERVINATIECIEREGIEAATIRRIAEYAGVNSAAISYYFRSKKRLIDTALARTLDNAFTLDDFDFPASATPHEVMVSVLEHLVEGALRYPGISRAHFHEVLVVGDYSSPAVARLNGFAETLRSELMARGVELAGNELRIAIVQLLAATILYASFMPGVFNTFAPDALTGADSRRAYIERLVFRLLE
jgi:AcrR family transcriptional regulator